MSTFAERFVTVQESILAAPETPVVVDAQRRTSLYAFPEWHGPDAFAYNGDSALVVHQAFDGQLWRHRLVLDAAGVITPNVYLRRRVRTGVINTAIPLGYLAIPTHSRDLAINSILGLAEQVLTESSLAQSVTTSA